MNAIIIGLVAFFTACVTALGAYMIARRTKSGKIDTTDAETLWKESAAIRTELRNEVITLRSALTAAQDLTIRLSASVDTLTKQVARLRRQMKKAGLMPVNGEDEVTHE